MSQDSSLPAQAKIVEAAVARVLRRKASAFRREGEDFCRRHVEASVRALAQDLRAGTVEGVRGVAGALMDELGEGGVGFIDLRSFVSSLRREVRAALAAEPGPDELRASNTRTAVEEWFFELLLILSMRFMVLREEATQEELARRGVEHLESQLAEFEQAVVDKTQLLDVIRQASTPIVPVVSGILVVPLVGTFDAFRAEILTEKLLEEIARFRARTAILDISGVPMFDSQAAQLIIRLARTVRLLGARVFVVGMSPGTARTVVGLGIDLSAIQSFATLQDGLARALTLQDMKIVDRARSRA